jgi:hypothetical protein
MIKTFRNIYLSMIWLNRHVKKNIQDINQIKVPLVDTVALAHITGGNLM